jgi:hypothetical protein
VKLPAHRAGLPGKVISFYIVPLDPAYKAGLAGHVPVKIPLYLDACLLVGRHQGGREYVYEVSNISG